jgi:SAM-dependent MidA family methyltransferase
MTTPGEIIRREIVEHGVLSFARFMQLALYCPNSGYYETKKDNPGRRGDFYTSVSVGEVFGQLLAFQFAEWLDDPPPATHHWSPRLIEAGAHDGQLASDILAWLQLRRPKLFERIEYNIVEPSARRQEWQRETLKPFAARVRWFTDWENLSRATGHASLRAVIFSNELLDAMPVRRFGWDAKTKAWFEWGVALEGGKFVWAKIPNSELRTPDSESPSSIFHLPSSFLDVLPDGYIIETCPAAENWWREAAGVLGFGRLITIDYGLSNDELFSPGRTRGTLRAYFRHHACDDLLANAGEQDLTAHVNFSTLQSVGEAGGLQTEIFSTQAKFLTGIVEKIFKNPDSFGEWGARQTRQFQTLTHPEHLGRAFRVLVQSGSGAP